MKQKFSFILCAIGVFGLGSLYSLDFQNVPSHFLESQHVIPYSTTKNRSNGALKMELLQKLKAISGAEVFIESGTYLGNTTALAAEIFDEVHSIEIFSELYSKAKQRFLRNLNVSMYLGDSPEVMSLILPRIQKRTLFYLDGHYNGGNTGKGKKNTPILEEIAAIRDTGRTDSVILIDDICNFQESKYPKRIANTLFDGYPNLKTLLGELLKINPKYQFCFLGNALLVFPTSLNLRVSPVAYACTIDRLSTVMHFSEDELKEAEMIIASSSGDEKEELLNGYTLFGEFELNHGWRSFSTFWYGLILQKEGAGADARSLFEVVKENSLPGWRVNRYL
jgi:hypothetical protein